MITKTNPAQPAAAEIVPLYPPVSRELGTVLPFRPSATAAVMGHGAFIRARTARGMRVTVASLPLVRSR